MKHFFCTAFLLSFLNVSTSQSTACFNLKERCSNANNECESVWNLMEDVCDISGKKCLVRDSQSCNITINYLTKKYQEFSDCICSEDIYCSIRRLLGKQCTIKNVHTSHIEPMKSEISILQKSSIKQNKFTELTPVGKVNDCSLAKQLCKENPNCYSLYENFRRSCIINAKQCTHHHHGARQLCLSSWSELKETIMGNCVCLNPTKEKCAKVWNSIHNNTCLQQFKEKTMATYREEDNELKSVNTDPYATKTNIRLEWELSSLKNLGHRSPRPCLEVATLCIGDPVCNRYLAALLKTCPAEGKVCNVENCQRTIRSFYDNMPFNVSGLLALCYCTESDEDCQHTRDVLHSKPCSVHADPPTSCLNVVHKCLEDEMCRQRYELYQSKCWQDITRCSNDESCLLDMNQDDLSCSGDDECKAAYIGTLGTKLHMQCSCTQVHNTEKEHLCHLFYHVLHSRSCFKKVTPRNIHASYSDTQDKGIILTSPHSLQNGAVIYIVAYTSGIILISGIILLALLQTRACRTHKKGKNPRGNVTESLMTP